MTDTKKLELIIQSGYYTGDTASLERDTIVTDQTGQEHHGDKLTITTYIERVEYVYFITPKREVFRFGQAPKFHGATKPSIGEHIHSKNHAQPTVTNRRTANP